MRKCSRCSRMLPTSEFTKYPRSRDGLTYWCKSCTAERNREYNRSNRERIRLQQAEYRDRNREKLRAQAAERFAARNPQQWSENTRWQRIASKYGLTREQYEALVASQDGKCAICDSADRALVVDHDHFCCPDRNTCGQCLRGLICSPCNLKLGWLEKHWPQIARHATGKLAFA